MLRGQCESTLSLFSRKGASTNWNKQHYFWICSKKAGQNSTIPDAYSHLTRWWFQPIWKNICQIGSFPQTREPQKNYQTTTLFLQAMRTMRREVTRSLFSKSMLPKHNQVPSLTLPQWLHGPATVNQMIVKNSSPIASMCGVFTYIYRKHQTNVGKFIPYMDGTPGNHHPGHSRIPVSPPHLPALVNHRATAVYHTCRLRRRFDKRPSIKHRCWLC